MPKVVIRPRLETVSFSLYWKEPLMVDTQCLDDVSLDFPDGFTGAELLRRLAEELKWRSVSELKRLPGFEQPWERVIVKGRELAQDQPLTVSTDPEEFVVVAVRRVLKADGWGISQADDFLASDDDDDI